MLLCEGLVRPELQAGFIHIYSFSVGVSVLV